MPKRVRVSKKILWEAIRKQCVECMGGSMSLIPGCTSKNCSLFPFRMGARQTLQNLKKDTPEVSKKPESRGEKLRLSSKDSPENGDLF